MFASRCLPSEMLRKEAVEPVWSLIPMFREENANGFCALCKGRAIFKAVRSLETQTGARDTVTFAKVTRCEQRPRLLVPNHQAIVKPLVIAGLPVVCFISFEAKFWIKMDTPTSSTSAFCFKRLTFDSNVRTRPSHLDFSMENARSAKPLSGSDGDFVVKKLEAFVGS